MGRRCGQQYIGETEQKLNCRMSSHWYDIVYKRTKESPVAEHINGIAHLQADMRVMVIDQLRYHEGNHGEHTPFWDEPQGW